ncbi:MAG: T9SS type A sorting domain-containing protein [Flavobacteriia bacterium]|nr:T9SS type A sorting domain-containing protein [Flavobacteriia bacterium]
MKNKILIVCILTLSFFKTDAQIPCKEIVGYYPNWQWYDRSKLVNPLTINYSKYSILNYCFFSPQLDGSILSTDSWADENLLLGQPNWTTGGYFPNTSIVDLAHNHNTKIIPSIGGWTLSGNFPIIAADPVKRVAFAQACVNLIQTYNFDGIDIDWEYPGYADHGGSAQDKNNYTLLLQAIRTAIDNYGIAHNKTMLLTAAVGAAEDRMDDVDWTAVSGILDIINLMTYDFFGSWDVTSNHNAPLYAPTQGDPTFNCDYAINKLISVYNVSPQKITLGVPFYGRSSKTTGTPSLFGSNAGSVDGVTFIEDEGSPEYYNIVKNMGLFTEHWDNTAKVPYLTGNGSLNTFVSYDNEQSIGLKAKYIVDHNLRGAIIWEITGDYLETAPNSGVIANTPLVDTLNHVFCNYNSGVVVPGTPSIIWNNPSNIIYGTALNSVQLNALANVTGTFVYTPNSGTILPVGSHTLSVLFTPLDNVNYTTVSATVQIDVTKASPVLIWNNPANISFGTALTSTQLNAISSVSGSFVYSPVAGTILPVGIHSLNVNFMPNDNLNYLNSNASVEINVVTNSELELIENHINNIILYPNPANSSLLFTEELTAVEVFSIHGKKIFETIEKANSISTAELSDGVYYLVSKQGFFKFTVKH